jgi:hypothetical protein
VLAEHWGLEALTTMGSTLTYPRRCSGHRSDTNLSLYRIRRIARTSDHLVCNQVLGNEYFYIQR